MYEELISHLRECAKRDHSNNTYKEAADAIEELSMRLHGDEAAIAGMKREIERMVVAEKLRWIPVSERLPEKRENVVFRSRGGSVYIGNCVLGTYPPDSEIVAAWFGCGAGMVHDITHWMPLPQGPEEE